MAIATNSGSRPIHSFTGRQINRSMTENTKAHRPSSMTRQPHDQRNNITCQVHGQENPDCGTGSEDRENVKDAAPHNAATMTEARHIGFLKQAAALPDADWISWTIQRPQYTQKYVPSMPPMTGTPI